MNAIEHRNTNWISYHELCLIYDEFALMLNFRNLIILYMSFAN